jgi:hypothetical protein
MVWETLNKLELETDHVYGWLICIHPGFRMDAGGSSNDTLDALEDMLHGPT